MKYAIIKSGGKQYKVVEGKEVLVDKLDLKENSAYVFPEILMLRLDENILIGTPTVKNAVVKGNVIGEVKGEKIRVSKYKAKIRYRRTTGFRPKYTKIMIDKIGVTESKEEAKEKKTPKKVAKKK
jgi:large subunit ribosomal protein L21